MTIQRDMYFYVKHVEEGLLRGGISLLLFFSSLHYLLLGSGDPSFRAVLVLSTYSKLFIMLPGTDRGFLYIHYKGKVS